MKKKDHTSLFTLGEIFPEKLGMLSEDNEKEYVEKRIGLLDQINRLTMAMNLINQAYWWFLNNNYNNKVVETSMNYELGIKKLIEDIQTIEDRKDKEH